MPKEIVVATKKTTDPTPPEPAREIPLSENALTVLGTEYRKAGDHEKALAAFHVAAGPGKGAAWTDEHLFNGEYFIQKIQWEGLHTEDPTKAVSWTVNYSPEAEELLRKEGPKYQYGDGCLSDGVLGAWIAETASEALVAPVALGTLLLGGAIVLLVLSLAATWIPARRAMGIDPAEALQVE